MSGIGVVTNPRSRRNRRDPGVARTLSYVLGERGQLVAPDDLDALDKAAVRFQEHGIEVLCINGGDGTVHRSLTAMVRAYGGEPLPPVAILRGGTMNIVADSIGNRVPAEAMLAQVVDAYHTRSDLPEIQAHMLRIELGDGPPSYGFLSGNGIIARFLELYYEQTDPTPMDAARLLARGSLSALVGGRLIRRLTRPWRGTITLDGARLAGEEWVAVAIGTVEQMGLGFRVFHLLLDHPGQLQVVGIGGSVANLARDLWPLSRGQGVGRPGNLTELGRELVLEGDEPQQLMIDGDFYVAEGGRVRYTLGPRLRLLLPR